MYEHFSLYSANFTSLLPFYLMPAQYNLLGLFICVFFLQLMLARYSQQFSLLYLLLPSLISGAVYFFIPFSFLFPDITLCFVSLFFLSLSFLCFCITLCWHAILFLSLFFLHHNHDDGPLLFYVSPPLLFSLTMKLPRVYLCRLSQLKLLFVCPSFFSLTFSHFLPLFFFVFQLSSAVMIFVQKIGLFITV